MYRKIVGVRRNEIKGIFWNVAGVKNKRTEFWKYIEEFDIVGLMETWVDEKEWGNMKQKLPSGWKWRYQEAKREKKKGRAMGGIITGVREGIEEEEGDTGEREGIQERRIKVEKEKWRIISVYNREGKKEKLEQLRENFNARIGERGGWQEGEEDRIEEGRKSKDDKVNREGKELIKMIEERGWLVLNGEKEGDEKGEWTYEKDGKRSVIDYGIVNWEAEKRIQRFEVGDRVESDHQPIIIKWTGKWKRKEIKEEESEGKVQSWTKEGEKKYREKMEKVQWKEKEVEKEWEELEREIKKGIPERKRGKRKELGWVPWWDEECRGKKREAHRSRREYRKTQEEEDYKRYIRKRKEYRDTCEKKKEEYRIEERREVENIKTEEQAWKFINKRRKRRVEINTEINIEEWEKHFMEVLGGERKEERKEKAKRKKRNDREISEEEVRREIKRLKRGKAAGADELRNEVWLAGGEKVEKKLKEIINKVWRGEGFPDKWRVGVVVPIWKRGERNVVSNYRGVTLTSTAYKIYASILNKEIVKDLDEKEGWGRTQAGFRKNRGTIGNIRILKHIIGRRISKGEKVWAFFIDLKAAFDKLDREILWDMMRRRGISEVLIERVKEIYEETRCRVKIYEKETKEFWVKKGVRQGCPLSPTLFNIYIADIEEEMRKGPGGVKIGKDKIWTLEYADDIVVVAEKEEGLRAMMKMIKVYVDKKKLELSAEKSKVVVFKRDGGRGRKRKWWWGKEEIEEVKKIKYLGYEIRSNNREEEHVRKRIRKARVAMGWVWSYGERKFKGDIRWRLKLFDSIVKGVLMYGVEIWGYKEWEEIEKLQTKYLRWIVGVDWRTPGYIVREELKREKIRISAGERAGRFEERMTEGKVGEIGKICMREKRKDEREREEKEWTRESLERRGYLWRCRRSEEAINGEGEDKWRMARMRDKEVDEQERGEKVRNTRSCKEYQRVEGIPGYVRENRRKKDGKKIQTIARWRCGNETKGNWYCLKEQERRCRLCGREGEDMRHLKKCECLTGERRVDVLNGDGRGYEWMLKIEKMRSEKEKERKGEEG